MFLTQSPSTIQDNMWNQALLILFADITSLQSTYLPFGEPELETGAGWSDTAMIPGILGRNLPTSFCNVIAVFCSPQTLEHVTRTTVCGRSHGCACGAAVFTFWHCRAEDAGLVLLPVPREMDGVRVAIFVFVLGCVLRRVSMLHLTRCAKLVPTVRPGECGI